MWWIRKSKINFLIPITYLTVSLITHINEELPLLVIQSFKDTLDCFTEVSVLVILGWGLTQTYYNHHRHNTVRYNRSCLNVEFVGKISKNTLKRAATQILLLTVHSCPLCVFLFNNSVTLKALLSLLLN